MITSNLKIKYMSIALNFFVATFFCCSKGSICISNCLHKSCNTASAPNFLYSPRFLCGRKPMNADVSCLVLSHLSFNRRAHANQYHFWQQTKLLLVCPEDVTLLSAQGELLSCEHRDEQNFCFAPTPLGKNPSTECKTKNKKHKQKNKTKQWNVINANQSITGITY